MNVQKYFGECSRGLFPFMNEFLLQHLNPSCSIPPKSLGIISIVLCNIQDKEMLTHAHLHFLFSIISTWYCNEVMSFDFQCPIVEPIHELALRSIVFFSPWANIFKIYFLRFVFFNLENFIIWKSISIKQFKIEKWLLAHKGVHAINIKSLEGNNIKFKNKKG